MGVVEKGQGKERVVMIRRVNSVGELRLERESKCDEEGRETQNERKNYN